VQSNPGIRDPKGVDSKPAKERSQRLVASRNPPSTSIQGSTPCAGESSAPDHAFDTSNTSPGDYYCSCDHHSVHAVAGTTSSDSHFVQLVTSDGGW
jgi:hypothetical protein